MEEIGNFMSHWGYTLRSGGASGADTAFERGCDAADGQKEIYVPWIGFNGRKDGIVGAHGKSLAMAQQYHPAWDRCSPGARKLHARNCCQILGLTLDDPVQLVVCWSPGHGGTEQALRIAKDYQIPIFNLKDPKRYDDLIRFIRSF